MLKRTVPVLTFAVALGLSSAGYALDDDETEVELSGTIASVTCPSLTVKTASGPITVNTTDEDGEAADIEDQALVFCEDLKVGDEFEIKEGELDASAGKVTADEISVNDNKDMCTDGGSSRR